MEKPQNFFFRNFQRSIKAVQTLSEGISQIYFVKSEASKKFKNENFVLCEYPVNLVVNLSVPK
jgi:hypothetical protein